MVSINEQFDVDPDITLTGFQVDGPDGKVGVIDEATYATDEAQIVVRVGMKVVGKRYLVGVDKIERIDADDETVVLSVGKDVVTEGSQYVAEGQGSGARGSPS